MVRKIGALEVNRLHVIVVPFGRHILLATYCLKQEIQGVLALFIDKFVRHVYVKYVIRFSLGLVFANNPTISSSPLILQTVSSTTSIVKVIRLLLTILTEI